MNLMWSVASYLGRQFIRRIFEFLEHWYWGSFQAAGEKFMGLLTDWDKVFALKVTLHYWLQPLYQDRTFIGYVLGPIFRTGRIVFALVVYLIASLFAGLLYALWLLIPPYIIYKILMGFFNFQ